MGRLVHGGPDRVGVELRESPGEVLPANCLWPGTSSARRRLARITASRCRTRSRGRRRSTGFDRPGKRRGPRARAVGQLASSRRRRPVESRAGRLDHRMFRDVVEGAAGHAPEARGADEGSEQPRGECQSSSRWLVERVHGDVPPRLGTTKPDGRRDRPETGCAGSAISWHQEIRGPPGSLSANFRPVLVPVPAVPRGAGTVRPPEATSAMLWRGRFAFDLCHDHPGALG